MADQGVRPNVKTFNATLRGVVQGKKSLQGNKNGVVQMFKIFNEMKNLGIGKPPLSTLFNT